VKFKPLIISRLFLRFLWHCVLSGLITARMIVQGGAPAAGLMKMKYKPMSQAGVAVLGAVVTLTPGSTTVDVNRVEREFLLHFLDTRIAAESISAIQRDFAQDIRVLFPEKKHA